MRDLPDVIGIPPVTRVLLGANLAVQIVLALAGGVFASHVIAEAGLVPARLTGALRVVDASVPPMLTLVSALFIHGGWLHLGMNSLFLIAIARFVEPLFGSAQFLVIYFVGGVAGGLAQTLVDPGSLDPVIGASGAISSVFGTYVMRFAARPDPPAPLARAARLEWFIAFRFALAWGALQWLVSLAGFGIAVWAHVGGFLAGLIFGVQSTRE